MSLPLVIRRKAREREVGPMATKRARVCAAWAVIPAAFAGPAGAADDLFVSSFSGLEVRQFDGTTGAYKGSPAQAILDGPHGIAFLPDGDLLVAAGHGVLRFDARTGESEGDFVAPFSGGLGMPIGLTFGPDGNLYVSDLSVSKVLRYDGRTGAFLDTFAEGGVNRPTDLHFGPDGNLYVAGNEGDHVVRYDGRTGAF